MAGASTDSEMTGAAAFGTTWTQPQSQGEGGAQGSSGCASVSTADIFVDRLDCGMELVRGLGGASFGLAKSSSFQVILRKSRN